MKKKKNCQKLYFQVEIGVKMALKIGPKIKIKNNLKLKLVQKWANNWKKLLKLEFSSRNCGKNGEKWAKIFFK